MFTKYTGIEVPQNYSGNRFKKEVEKTEMKTHRGQISSPDSGIKAAVSPSFQEVIDNAVSDKGDTEQYASFDEDDINQTTEAPLDEICDVVKTMSRDEEESNTIEATLKRFFDSIGKDELLLLSLLVLFASDNQDCGIDGVIIVALLLMYR